MTNIELDKINDLDMHLFIEQGMRGGVCYAAKKYSKANDLTKLTYFDMNNLYGKAMISYLPYGSFRWIRVTDKNINKALSKKDNSLHGYFLEVDIFLPDELHDYQNCFPVAPEKLHVTEDMLSKEQIEDIKKFNIKIGLTKNLIPNLYPKKNYVIHYRNLKHYLDDGWKLTKVHRILEFKQSPWMKPYIDFNTEKKNASN